MALTLGTRLGVYEIIAQIGEGGMGQVFHARDTKLDRDVAIKILPEAFAYDADRVARFTREAKTLASLNHPNIAGIYGLEESGGVSALVMELVGGDDLSQRIARGAIPIDEALPIAKQIAGALEAAHEQGIIHRDLKPANVKVRPDGTVKVLDFGLAKAMGAPEGGHDDDELPTITSPAMTRQGVILGTAAYMSPEQARGREADKRSDLWAFGCVLYEMLTARRPFGPTLDQEAAGDSSRRASDEMADTLAAVLTREPDWTALPATVPPPLRVVLRRCLQKERRQRIGDVAAALVLIEEVGSLGAAGSLDGAAVQPRVDAAVARARTHLQRVMRVRMAVVAVGAILVGGGVVGGGMWLATRPAPPRVLQFTIATTPATALTINGADRDVAITPDGARVIYAGKNGTELFVRALDTLEPVHLYTGAPRAPIVSPDGQWIAFVDATTTLKKVAITGGPPVTLAALEGFSRGATWLPDDTIVFGTSASGTGLQQVAARGGPVTVLTHPDRARGEGDHLWPEALPGGRAVLFTILPTTGGMDAAQIAVFDLQTQAQTVVVRGGSHAHYVASGHLVYAAGGSLRAMAFDPATRTARGVSVPVVPDVVTTGSAPVGGVEAALAADGTLAYVRGTDPRGLLRTLVWVDRHGRETPLAAPPRPYIYPRISPDGGRVLINTADQDGDLWVWDVARLTLTRLTFAPGQDTYPVWAPDGRVLFSSERDGAMNLYAQAADGTGVADRWTTSPNPQQATAVTPDGTRLLFMERAPQTGDDVRQVTVTSPHTVTPLVQTAAAERNGMVSSDGRWLAYEANDSGSFEIYVRPYPDVAGGRWQVSAGGGTRPLWSRDGRELFYVSPRNALLRVGVERGASWKATTPAVILADDSVISPPGLLGRSYDVSPDGQRFLLLKEASAPNATPTQLVVLQHFDALLRRLVPTK